MAYSSAPYCKACSGTTDKPKRRDPYITIPVLHKKLIQFKKHCERLGIDYKSVIDFRKYPDEGYPKSYFGFSNSEVVGLMEYGLINQTGVSTFGLSELAIRYLDDFSARWSSVKEMQDNYERKNRLE